MSLLCGAGKRGSSPKPSHSLRVAGLEVLRSFPTPKSSTSGLAGALQDITLSQQTTSTWKDTGLMTVMSITLELTGIDTITASTSVLPPGEGPEVGKAVFVAKVAPSLTSSEETTHHPSSETTSHPTTHQGPTARATTGQALVTSHPYRDMQPDHHETSAPTGSGHLDPPSPSAEGGGPFATEKTADNGVTTKLPAGEGSGEPVSAHCCPLRFLGLWVASG